MKHIVLAPHLDDEVIGCYSVWDKIDTVVYFTKDYRIENVTEKLDNFKLHGIKMPEYIYVDDFNFDTVTKEDTVYLPSKFDYHPLHRKVRNKYLLLPGKKMFYSIDMNTPWNKEEERPDAKLEMLKLMYPGETLFLNDAKYYLFCSVKPYDELMFHVLDWPTENMKIRIQELDGDKKIHSQVMSLLKPIKDTSSYLTIFRTLQHHFPNRIIKVEYSTWGSHIHTIE